MSEANNLKPREFIRHKSDRNYESNRKKEIQDFIKKYGHYEIRAVLKESYPIYRGM